MAMAEDNLRGIKPELLMLKNKMVLSLLTVGEIEPRYLSVFANFPLDLHEKYGKIALDKILVENCRSLEDVEKVSGALVVLSKYASNLLQPQSNRPVPWNVIDFANTIFRERVQSVLGTQNILNKLGYKAGTRAMVFSPSGQPNREMIAEICAELMAGNVELSNYVNQRHPCRYLVEKYLSFLAIHGNNLSAAKVLDALSTAELEISLVEESKQKKENATVETAEMPQDNIPLMVLDQMVSIPPDITATEILAVAGDNCDICGKKPAEWTCHLCDDKFLCTECDNIWHMHQKRRDHRRTPYGAQKAEIENVGGKVGNGVYPYNPVADLNWLVFTPNTALSVAHSTPSATVNFLTSVAKSSSRPSPVFSNKFAPSSSYVLPAPKTAAQPQLTTATNNVKEDDFDELLSKAKHPPAFYTPPEVTRTLRKSNGESGAGYDIAQAPMSMFLPVSRVINHSPSTLLNPRVDQTSQPYYSVASRALIANGLPPPTAQNAVGSRERTFDRSASASGILSGNARGTNNTANREAKKFLWDCEHCTFKNLGNSKICSMCHKTNDNLQIIGNDVSNDAVKITVTSPSHLMRTASAFEPLMNRSQNSNQSANEKQFESKFVGIADEMYDEKKRAQEQFKREQSQKHAQMLNSQSVEDLQIVGSPVPMVAVTATEVPTVSQAHLSSVEHRRPVNSAAHNQGRAPVGSHGIGRNDYRSSFVELADEIYFEKKAAQRRFEQMEIENATNVESASRNIDDVEFRRAQSMLFHGHGAASGSSNLKQPALALRDTTRMGTRAGSTLSVVEILEREKRSQDMFNNGLAVVRLIKAVESRGYSDAELRVILSICGAADPYSFYQDRWSGLIEAVIQKLREQSIISKQSSPLELVRLSLAKSKGDVANAVAEYKNLWRERVEIILRDCGLEENMESKRQVTSILDEKEGNIEAAKTIIIRDKFHKHIWNDDRQTDANAEIGAGDIYHRPTNHLNSVLSKILMDKAYSRERRTRMILAETHLPGWQRAENVLTIFEEPSLLNSEATLTDIVDAVKNCGTVDESRQFLQQQCEICFDSFPCRLIKSMGCCQCKICSNCMEQYFEVVIRERFVRNLVCPVCSLPEIDTASEQTETHFQFLLLMLRNMVASETYELFQMKLRDWNLMMDPSFRWCASISCKSGFLIDPEQRQNKIACPHCRSFMCERCKKPWEDQHEGLNCEDYQSWKENNDPEVQALGLARHLEENGIECPRCKCRYSLAKGGCMHFTCIQCRHEFCSGCLQPFRRGQNCTLLRSCAKAGLHCHHPRDCLFYLRDRDIIELQHLLRDNGIAYDTEPSQTRLLAGPDGQRCSVMEQKQTQSGFKDEPCGKEVPSDFAGLCEIHYKEYLVGLINKNNIDPVKIMKQEELIILLKRVDKKIPKKQRHQSNEEYEGVLLKMVQDQLPLLQRQIRQTAQDTILSDLADVTDGHINLHHLQLNRNSLIGRGVPRALMELGMLPNHTQITRIKDSGYSSLTSHS